MKNQIVDRTLRVILALAILLLGVGVVALIFYYLGVFDQFINIQEFGSSWYGHVMYFTSYIFVKLSMILPLGPVVIAFNQVAPDWSTIVVGSLAEIVGGVLLYLLGRYAGKNLIEWVAGKKALDKYKEKMNAAKYTIFLLLLFPFAPNQIVMILCGSGKMKWRTYFPIIAIAQPIGVATTVYGFKTLALLQPLWLFIPLSFGIIVTVMYLSFRYQNQIDNFVKTKILRE